MYLLHYCDKITVFYMLTIENNCQIIFATLYALVATCLMTSISLLFGICDSSQFPYHLQL